MMKRIVVLLLAAMLVFGMIGCGTTNNGNGPTGDSQSEQDSGSLKEFKPEELVNALITGIAFTGKIEEVPADDLEWYIDMEEGVTGIMYAVSGVSSEEVAVFTAPDEKTATQMVKNVEAMLEDQLDQNAAYDSKVSQRIDNAVIEKRGCYVILCVSDDSAKAKTIIRNAFGE